MNHIIYPLLSKLIFLKNPKISFPNQNPRPQTIEPALRIFNYRASPPLFLTIEWHPGDRSCLKKGPYQQTDLLTPTTLFSKGLSGAWKVK